MTLEQLTATGSRPRSSSSGVLDASLVLDALPRAIIVTDRRGYIIEWNDRATQLLGWSRDDVVGTDAASLMIAPAHAEEVATVVKGTLVGEAWAGELTLCDRAGRDRPMAVFMDALRDGTGEVVGTVTALEDRTGVRALEQRAAALSDHLLLALESGRLGTWKVDLDTGELTWDATTESLFGFEPGTFDGQRASWAERIHPDDLALATSRMEEALVSGSFSSGHRVVWPDGSTHWLEARGRVVVSSEGAPLAVIGCTADVTASKLAELHSKERAEAAEHFAAIERRRRERMEFLGMLNEAALEAIDHRDLMARVASAAVPRLGDWCTVHFFPHPDAAPEIEVGHVDPSRVEWARRVQARFPYDPDAPFGVPAALRTGTTQLIGELDSGIIEAVLAHRPAVDADTVRSVIATIGIYSVITVPLKTKGGTIGAIQFVSAESRRPYDEDDIALAEAAAGRLAAALHSAWLGDLQRNVSSRLQAALLPARLPQIDGLDVAVVYRAGAGMEVGGDFYDLFAIPGPRWAAAIGDVCGTGPDAAAVTAKARHTIRAAATHSLGHVEVMRWLNDAIRAGERGLFCTSAYATFERVAPRRWKFTSVVGGHPLPICMRADGRVHTMGIPGTLLGVMPEIEVATELTFLVPGDVIVMYTDGFTDARPPHDLDDDAFQALIRDAGAGTTCARELADRIVAAVEAIQPIRERNDDLALMVLRITEPTATAGDGSA